MIAVHVASGGPNLLAGILDGAGLPPATPAAEGEPLLHGRIYAAPADHHLVIEVRV